MADPVSARWTGSGDQFGLLAGGGCWWRDAPQFLQIVEGSHLGFEQVNDDIAGNGYPLPLELAGRDNCQVGRIRKDCAMENGLSFWVAGDQLLKGAALNAVQIAEQVARL